MDLMLAFTQRQLLQNIRQLFEHIHELLADKSESQVHS